MTEKKPKRPRDPNELAKRILDIATGDVSDEQPPESDMAKRGRSGGLRGGKERAKVLSPERRREIAEKAAKSRWHKK